MKHTPWWARHPDHHHAGLKALPFWGADNRRAKRREAKRRRVFGKRMVAEQLEDR